MQTWIGGAYSRVWGGVVGMGVALAITVPGAVGAWRTCGTVVDLARTVPDLTEA